MKCYTPHTVYISKYFCRALESSYECYLCLILLIKCFSPVCKFICSCCSEHTEMHLHEILFRGHVIFDFFGLALYAD